MSEAPSGLQPALAMENAQTLAAIPVDLRRELFREMVERSPATETSVPVPHGNFWYYARQESGLAHWIYCRNQGEHVETEEILLDQNILAEGQAYCEVRGLRVSPDHQKLAYALDVRGDERCELWIRDVGAPYATARQIAENAGPTFAWSADGQTLFYTRLDDAHRADQLWSCHLGEVFRKTLVYRESDAAFRLSVGKTESDTYLLFTAKSPRTTEIRYLPADRPDEEPLLLARRRPGLRLALTHHGEYFYLLSNGDDAVQFKLLRVLITTPNLETAEEVVPHRPEVCLERVQAFSGHLVLWERCRGLQRLAIRDQRSGKLVTQGLPEEISAAFPGDNREYETPILRLGYSSLTTPFTIAELNMKTGQWEVKKRARVQGGFQRGRYGAKRLLALAADGTGIPISIVYRKDTLKEGGNPLLLYGYGAYGYRLECQLEPPRMSLLDRGIHFAMAHVRGGGELGETWHAAGRGLAKRRSITDFITCAEHLVAEGWAAPGKMATMGESAGGLLVAAAVNERPDLFAAVIADNPFVDVLGALLDPSLPLTVSDWEEWGDPRDESTRAYIESYSPLANVGPQDYPAILALAGMRDPWIPLSQVLRWIGRVRDATTGQRPVHLLVDPATGHRGHADRFRHLREIALKYAFLIRSIGES